MARMISSTIHRHVRSAAERRLFNVVGAALRVKECVCLHQFRLARPAMKRDGKSIAMLTRKSIFFLEARGRGISPERGIWRFKDRYGEIHEWHKCPFAQAFSGVFALGNLCAYVPGVGRPATIAVRIIAADI